MSDLKPEQDNIQRVDKTQFNTKARHNSTPRIFNGVENFRGYLIELTKIVTGTGIYKEQPSFSVASRSPDDLGLLLEKIKTKMEHLLNEKRASVEKLRTAAQNAMKNYGPYKEPIDFKEVKYINAKEVVIDKDIEKLDVYSRNEIKHTMNYMPTEPVWDFQPEEYKPVLNMNISSIHVPTNIYDKSMTILNGIEWSTNITDQFISNSREDSTLKWQYFCNSDGIFRIYPGVQWPREPDQVDTFDCRIRKWYIQAASSPKNILILLDSSGSMKGLRFAIARSTVAKIMDTLSDEDYFNVLQFSDEPKYVDECFNDTLMSASVDNIRRMQDKIALLEAKKFSNFEKALTKAFNLFKKEQIEFQGHSLCNKAIMIITDGAPENFDSVFDKYNWPEKSIRVFTFLIGKEVPDNRQTRWMACANKGKFMHISTRADVQENVQKYIKVLSRPLAIERADHEVWSPVYLDYVTEKAEIKVPVGRPVDLHMDFEMESIYKGLGLVMTMSMPVFDERTEVGPHEESPERNLLGVVGTDVRINELMRLIPTFELGVNGYAFAITNHGYILFHPDYRPFYSENKVSNTQFLKVKPKYNSVDLSEVELTINNASGWTKEHPLRKHLLMSRSGGDNMSSVTVLIHFDGRMRAKERRNHYLFKEIVNTFKLVFVLPDVYGTRYIEVDPKYLPTVAAVMAQESSTISRIDLSNWIYCAYGKSTTMIQMDIHNTIQYLMDGTIEQKCGKKHVHRLMMDLNVTLSYAYIWEGILNKYVGTSRENIYIKDYEKCWNVQGAINDQIQERQKCVVGKHISIGIVNVWIGTSSGITRHMEVDSNNIDGFTQDIQTTKSVYYKRAVDGWEDGFKYVFAGPVVLAQKDLNINNSIVTMSAAEVVGTGSMQVPAAVVAFSMRYSAFYDKFIQYTFNSSYAYSCSDNEHFYCYLIDNNGYILATNNPDQNGTGLFLGQHNGRLMRTLLDDNIFKQLKLTDYQSICETRVPSGHDSASSFIMNPFKLMARLFFWLVSEVIVLLSKWNLFGYVKSCLASGYELLKQNADVCGNWIPEEVVRYLCTFVIDEETGHRYLVSHATRKDSCVQSVARYTLNLNVLLSKPKQHQLADCFTQCASKNKISYEARWLNDTNLVYVVVDASCICNSSQFVDVESSTINRQMFAVKPKEVKYDEATQCHILFNFSEELKHVDETRNQYTICLDSANETDTPCSRSPAFIYSIVTSFISFAMSVLVLLKNCCCH